MKSKCADVDIIISCLGAFGKNGKTGNVEGYSDSIKIIAVVSGYWHGEEAAFKFIPVRKQQYQAKTSDGLADLATRLNEMLTMQSTRGSCILKILGHYR